MPHYFFDTSDGDRFVRDEQGLQLKDLSEARRHAIAALPDMARDSLHDVDRRDFVVGVRNGDGTYLLKAALSFAVQVE
jgi:hypothetical protein